jgi:hypothetical protein
MAYYYGLKLIGGSQNLRCGSESAVRAVQRRMPDVVKPLSCLRRANCATTVIGTFLNLCSYGTEVKSSSGPTYHCRK